MGALPNCLLIVIAEVDVLERIKTLQIRRLAILDRDKALMGIVSLGDVATEPRATALASVGSAVAEISEPSRPRK